MMQFTWMTLFDAIVVIVAFTLSRMEQNKNQSLNNNWSNSELTYNI